MNETSRFTHTVLLVWLLSSLTCAACTEAKEPVDLALFSDGSPTCWLDICPGVTSLDEAKLRLTAQPGLSVESYVEAPEDYPLSYVTWAADATAQSRGLVGGRLYPVDDSVAFVVLEMSSRVAMGDLAAVFGEPDLVNATRVRHETQGVDLTVRYLEKGIAVEYFHWPLLAPPPTIKLRPGLPVTEIVLSDPASPLIFEPWQLVSPTGVTFIQWPGWGSRVTLQEVSQ